MNKKILGLIPEYLNKNVVKAKMNIGIIEHLSKFLPLKTLDQMYKSLVRSHLEYCDIIRHIPSLQNQPSVGATLSSLMTKAESSGDSRENPGIMI